MHVFAATSLLYNQVLISYTSLFTAGYFLFPPKIDEIFVCHSPVPLDPSIISKIESAAKKQGVDLGDWKPDKLSCLGTRVPFKTMLEEIKDWLLANPEEFVILFLDTKPLTVVTKGQSDAASKVMRDVFGDMIWAKADGNILNKTIEELLSAGKRLFFEDHDECVRLHVGRTLTQMSFLMCNIGD